MNLEPRTSNQIGTTVVVVCPAHDTPEAGLLTARVAGLPMLLRTLLTAWQAGATRYVVVADPGQVAGLRPLVEADPRLAGRIEWRGEAPGPLAGPVLLLSPWTVLDPGSLRAFAAGGVPAAPDGSGWGPAVLPPERLAAGVAAARRGEGALGHFLEGLTRGGSLGRAPWGGSLRRSARGPGGIPGLERVLFEAMRTAEDGPVVDRFVNRRLSRHLTGWLLRTPVTPNQVTVASLLTGLLGAWALGASAWSAVLVGLCLFQLSVVLDHSDGELARLRFQFSRLGKWLDNWCDHLVDVAVIAGVTWRVAWEGGGWSPVLLGVAAAIGVTGSFLIVFWWSLAAERAEGHLPAAVAAMANRDGFCLALWATLLLGQPAWFLWALALGANGYWLLWLIRAGLPGRSGRAAAGS